MWRKGGIAAAPTPIVLFLIQLGLNTAWSILFFGLRMPGLAFFEILLLWLAILATAIAFWRSLPIAGYLFIPYLVWVALAAVLNFTIWRLNG
jgi:tryptophan-rich sensory protein